MTIRRARSEALTHAAVLVAGIQSGLLVRAVLECGAADRAFAPFVRLDDVRELFLCGAGGFLLVWGAVLFPNVGVAVAVFGGCCGVLGSCGGLVSWFCGGGGGRGSGRGRGLEGGFTEEEFPDVGIEAVEGVLGTGPGGCGVVPEPAHCWWCEGRGRWWGQRGGGVEGRCWRFVRKP